MARWEPDPRGRLLRAALDLFVEQGYDATTSAQLAEHAGLTKATVFRLFTDKREILFQGQDASVETAGAAVRRAPEHDAPLDALRSGLRALCEHHVPEQKEIGRRIDALLGDSVDLRERAAFKRSAIADALADALVERGTAAPVAGALADLGVRAYYDGFAEWTRTDDNVDTTGLTDLVRDRLGALLAALDGVISDDRTVRS